jgi:hypothetical protein
VGIIGLVAMQGFLMIGNRLSPSVDSPVREISPASVTVSVVGSE